jgi:hypothetical protein
LQRATTSASIANSLQKSGRQQRSVIFGARGDWGGLCALHVAPMSGADLVAAFRAAGVETDLWELGPRRGAATAVSLPALTRRRALEVVHGHPASDGCLVADPSGMVAGDLAVSLSSDRHGTLYAKDPARLGRALVAVITRRLGLDGALPAGSFERLVVPTEGTWFDVRVEQTERLTVLHVYDVDAGEEIDRFVRSRTVGWRAGFSW